VLQQARTSTSRPPAHAENTRNSTPLTTTPPTAENTNSSPGVMNTLYANYSRVVNCIPDAAASVFTNDVSVSGSSHTIRPVGRSSSVNGS
jgi:hypothetical protein